MQQPPQIDTKLILLDGLSGGGKSTMCQWLERQLHRNGIAAHWLVEADVPHPLHWWDYWDGSQHRAPDFGQHTPSEFIEASIGRWSAFAETVTHTDKVWIVESSLFLLGLGMLLQADAKPAELVEYGRLVEEVIRDLNPILFYFRQLDIRAHVRKICDIRGHAFESELIANMKRTPYFQARNHKGFEGIVSLWEESQQITDAIVSNYTIRTLSLETSNGNWETYRRQILEALSLPWMNDNHILGIHDMERITGNYRRHEQGSELYCTVLLNDGQLTIDEHSQHTGIFFSGPSCELMSISAQTFYAGISPIVVRFAEDSTGEITEMHVDSSRLGGGGKQVWIKDR